MQIALACTDGQGTARLQAAAMSVLTLAQACCRKLHVTGEEEMSNRLKLTRGLMSAFVGLAIIFAPSLSGAALGSGVLDLGVVLLGASKCVPASWSNLSPGNSLICDATGCRTQYPEAVRSVMFASSLSWASVTPGQASNVPITGDVSLSFCATPQASGDYNGQLSASVSPAFYGGSTSESRIVHVKAVPAALIGEPLNGTLAFGAVFVGQRVTKTFYVSNYTGSNATITGFSSNISGFTVSGGSGVGYVIPANGGQATVIVEFAPNGVGSASATVQVTTTGGSTTYPASGIGALPSISTSAGSGGTITPSTTVPFGGSLDVVLTPAAGYTLATLSDNGVDVFTNAHPYQPNKTFIYRLSNVSANHMVAASFKVGEFPTPVPSGQVPAMPPISVVGLALGLSGYVYWRSRRGGSSA